MAVRIRLALCLALVAACASPAPSSTPDLVSPIPMPTVTRTAQPTPQSTRPTPPATPTSSASDPPSIPTSAPPTPTATVAPSASPTTGLVISEADIARHLDVFVDIAATNGGLRASGLPGYDASVRYVEGELATLGLSVAIDPFEFEFFDEAAPVELVVGDQTWSGAEWMHAMIYSAPGSVAGELQPVALEGEFSIGTGGCLPEDWSGFVAGRIALIGSGPCFRRDQIVNAQDAGAIGVIALYPRWEANQSRRPTLFDPSGITVPAIAVGQAPTAALLAAAATGGTAQFTVESIQDERPSSNVIAEITGRGDEVVMVGGHLDSVLDGPGINDNGSGVAALLALAATLAGMPRPEATIRFGFWGAEEFGDIGSSAYVAKLPQSERDRIRAYINVDMVGSVNAARLVYRNELSPPASYEITAALLSAFEDLGAPAQTFDAGPSSDHFAFEQAGVPIGGVFSGLAPLSEEQAAFFGGIAGEPADPCYHLACDTRDNVDTATAQLFAQAIAMVVEDLAY